MSPTSSTHSRHAAIYARYSTNLQDQRSIKDQIYYCRKHLQTIGVISTTTYADAATTGTNFHQREALQKLLLDIANGTIDLVCTEALDRISRDLADISTIWKHLQFHRVELLTVEEGPITLMHIGMKGVMNQEFIHSLAHKTRRGQAGRVKEGRIPAGLCYGYRLANRLENNKVIRGLREIDPNQAAVVRRIYTHYADGMSAGAIADLLNEEGTPGVRGKPWLKTTITGSNTRRTGILCNPIYQGKIIFNRERYVRHPLTGKRSGRLNPESEWIIQDAPKLRIIDEKLWAQVQSRRRHPAELHPKKNKTYTLKPLTPLSYCGLCASPLTIASANTYNCSRHRHHNNCANHRRISTYDLEERSANELLVWAKQQTKWHTRARATLAQTTDHHHLLHRSIVHNLHTIAQLRHSPPNNKATNDPACRHVFSNQTQLFQHLNPRETDLAHIPIPRDITTILHKYLTALRDILANHDHPLRHNTVLLLRPAFQRINVWPGPSRGKTFLHVIPDPKALLILTLTHNHST